MSKRYDGYRTRKRVILDAFDKRSTDLMIQRRDALEAVRTRFFTKDQHLYAEFETKKVKLHVRWSHELKLALKRKNSNADIRELISLRDVEEDLGDDILDEFTDHAEQIVQAVVEVYSPLAKLFFSWSFYHDDPRWLRLYVKHSFSSWTERHLDQIFPYREQHKQLVPWCIRTMVLVTAVQSGLSSDIVRCLRDFLT